MTTTTLRGGVSTEDPRLDRIPLYDRRSLGFRIQNYEPLMAATVKTQEWPVLLHLDQGREGACVGFGYNHELCAEPAVVRGCSNDRARTDYYEIQRRDPWPGGAYPGARPFYEGKIGRAHV